MREDLEFEQSFCEGGCFLFSVFGSGTSALQLRALHCFFNAEIALIPFLSRTRHRSESYLSTWKRIIRNLKSRLKFLALKALTEILITLLDVYIRSSQIVIYL